MCQSASEQKWMNELWELMPDKFVGGTGITTVVFPSLVDEQELIKIIPINSVIIFFIIKILKLFFFRV